MTMWCDVSGSLKSKVAAAKPEIEIFQLVDMIEIISSGISTNGNVEVSWR